jgi:hypothetical protein
MVEMDSYVRLFDEQDRTEGDRPVRRFRGIAEFLQNATPGVANSSALARRLDRSRPPRFATSDVANLGAPVGVRQVESGNNAGSSSRSRARDARSGVATARQ